MHRILLYALVLGLFYFAWDARRGVALAGESKVGARVPGAAPGELLFARAEPDARGQFGTAPASSGIPAEDRLEARVESQGGDWADFNAQPGSGPPAEAVLSNAEHWVESNFPEGGRTEGRTEPETGKLDGVSGSLAELRRGADGSGELSGGSDARPGDADGAVAGPQDPGPIYVATLARIEGLQGGMPGWYGLLDLALRPAAARQGDPGLSASASFGPGDTAWISDDQGKLLARVEALDGIGLEFDRAWPWSARQRRLFWTETGVGGMPVHQYRLVLEGNGFGPSWTGRLVLVHSRAPGQESGR
jgi:hypothetical protein